MLDATSPRYQAQRTSQMPSTTPSVNPSMTPFLSPRERQKAPQTPSPNYFGFQGDDNSSFLSDTPNHAKRNWSPPSSAVRSTAALSPSVLPLDQSPQYEAFRKQSESSKTFNLGGLNNFKMSIPASSSKARPTQSRTTSRTSISKHSTSKSGTAPREIPASSHRAALDTSFNELSRSPKRVLSPGSMTESRRRGSPPTGDNVHSDHSSDSPRSATEPHDQQRFQLPLDNITASYNATKARAQTIPATTDSEDRVMITPQYVVNLLDSKGEDMLLLDLRVQTQYAMSHIASALNLCIPTTLLKRPSFNVQKLADTFKDEEQHARFENWRKSSHIIVYDGNSSLLKDATICLNTIKKFRGEGYDGELYIIRGGFNEFAKCFSNHVESGVDAQTNGASNGVEGDGPKVAPVVGGCPMPSTDKPANPFFGNIRQNMDLIGGVGQIAIKHPSKETKSAKEEYPDWLQTAAEEGDQGKRVSKRFEQIERREKKRMEDALSGNVSWGTPKKESGTDSVRIAGLEKGNKNRYNNIWPFEHSRVKLQGISRDGCDYFNASHIKAAWSNKRYISTQAPIPATFNDFWNVIWQQDVRVIVMLTAEKEGAQVKAHNYWDQRQYGGVHLEFLSEKRASLEPSRINQHKKQRPSTVKRHSTLSSNPQIPLAPVDSKEEKSNEQPYVIVRKFLVRHDRFAFEPPREVTQLQYSSWPDFGAPAHPAHLLGLVEQCNAVVRATYRTASGEPEPPNKRPILVHCSAGCGRTGTFCTVDSVIDMLKRQRISRDSRMDMDDDKTVSRSKSPPKQEEANGFFASQYREDNEGIDGGWTTRDDQDLVEKTVEDFRHQRLSMVQSLRQYVLCYESVMEWLVEQRQGGKSMTN